MAKDILTDISGNLLIEDGDFVIGDSEEQEIYEMMLANKNSYKENPLSGFGAIRKKNSVFNEVKVRSEIKAELRADGKKGRKIIFNNGLTDFEIIT